MEDIDDKNPNDADDPKVKAVAKYKKMVKKSPLQSSAADPTKELSPTNPLMVEKADGTVAQWGNALKPDQAKLPPFKMKPKQSDKANGTDNTYNPARGQQSGPSPQTIKPSFKY